MNDKKKNKITATDIYVVFVILLFTFFIDVVYPISHYMLNLQISDYWLVVNVVFYSIELICLTVYNAVKRLNPEQKETYREISHEVGMGIGAGAVSALSNNISLPTLTSGDRGQIEEMILEEVDEFNAEG